MYKISFYVPESHLEIVKNALFQVGAGKIGNYDCCAWQTKGVGQYRPLEGSNPLIGKENSINTLEEYLVEMVCENALIKEVVEALKASHPYETPAYAIWEIRNAGS